MTYGFDDDEDEEHLDWGVGVYKAVAPAEPSKAQVHSRDAARKLWEDVIKELRRGQMGS